MDMTGIPNADKLITKARMAGLLVTVESHERHGIAGMRAEQEMKYTIVFHYPELPRFAGTPMEDEYRESFYTAVFIRSSRPGARGRFVRLTHSRSTAVEFTRLALAAAQLDAMAADMAVLTAPLPKAATVEREPVDETPEPRVYTPSVTSVIRVLKRAGFQHSRYVDSQTRYRPYGFRVRGVGGEVLVTHEEGTGGFLERMAAGGYTDVGDVPRDPDEARMAKAYAGVLRGRYAVRMFESSVYCTAKPAS